ncbi:hypothetical protein MAP00_006676 [Monascus purpureus]|nr:hypothetical protein MAP00_006676 [Monascus purpureus]
MALNDAVAISGFFVNGLFRHPLDFYSSVGPTLSELTFGLCGESFVPERDIGDLTGKVVFVTGGNTGLGKETVFQLAHHQPSRIYLAARNEDKAREAMTSIQDNFASPVDIRYIPLDLTSFKSIQAAAKQFTEDCDRLDILILNAGVMGSPAITTEDGFEIQMGTNHIGHFLLTKLLLPTLQETVASAIPAPDVRVVTVASLAYTLCTPSKVMMPTSALLEASTWTRYGASKAANIIFAAELARRYPDILSVSVHPGMVASELYERARAVNPVLGTALVAAGSIFFRSVRSGALNQLWAAGAKRNLLTNGAYYAPVGIQGTRNEYATNEEMGKRLWEWTEEQIGEILAAAETK